MTDKEIVERAAKIVRRYLDDAEYADDQCVYVNRADLIQVSTALAVAGVLCLINDEWVGK